MAWNSRTPDKDEIAKELFGVDAATVKARLEKLDTIEGTLATTKQTIEQQNTLISSLTESIKSMKVQSPYDSPGGDANNYNTSGAGGGNSNSGRPVLTDWGENADEAFAQRIAPMTNVVLSTSVSLARRNAKEQLDSQYHDWNLFADEVDEISKNSLPAQKVNEEFWKTCYFAVKGKHHDEIIRDQNQKSGKFWTEPAGSGVLARDIEKKPEDVLSEAEKKMAVGMGVPLEKYMEYKHKAGV